MKTFGVCLIMTIFAFQATVLRAQSVERPTPWFTLSIAEKPLSAENSPGAHILQVKYTNISNTVQQDNCVNRPQAYETVVLRDGVQVGKKKRKSEDSDEASDPRRVKVPFTGAVTCGRITKGVPPQTSVTFPLWISSYYDMTEPGTYSVTVKRETFPNDPAKSVTVWSNTITIVVPSDNHPPVE